MSTNSNLRAVPRVNNDFYDRLGERWYSAQDDPVALLRAESRARNPWVVSEISAAFPDGRATVLDVGCGAGFLTNELARHGFQVTGLDASPMSLALARQYDATRSVRYDTGVAESLPYPAQSFRVVCALDLLEHVEDPERIVSEIARVLAPGGLFFFHTFNRNLLSWLIVIKGIEWFVKNTPANMHCLRYFIKPAELRAICLRNRLRVETMKGLAPRVFQRAFWKMILTGVVPEGFAFRFTRSTPMGYLGVAVKYNFTAETRSGGGE